MLTTPQTVLTSGKLSVNVGNKVLHCDLTMTSVLCYICAMVVNSTCTCKPARVKLTQDKQSYWCIRYLIQLHSEHHHRNMSFSIVQGVKYVPHSSIVSNLNAYPPTVLGLL